jgi:NADPH-dependent 2,4-dienoyl-CoA reductase/sulfur reductase-like enzyme
VPTGPPGSPRAGPARRRRPAYDHPVKTKVVVLGAGFGGLELSTMLSEALGDEVDVTLIDKNDAFVFGYSKLDVMFGRTTPDAVRLAYGDIAKPGVRFLQQTITAIDPEARTVTTDGGVHEADYLVVALGADYDLDATPGLAVGDNEFYSVSGAERLGELLPGFSQGRAIVGVCGHRSSARRHRASARCCCTTTCRRGASATSARSPLSSRSEPRCPRHRIRPGRWLQPLPSVTSSSWQAVA